MMAGRGMSDADGGPARHIPVLAEEAMRFLNPKPGEVHIDGTFGAGGYSRAILAAGARVIAIDRDSHAIAAGETLVAQSNSRLSLVEDRFARLDAIAREQGLSQVDGVVLDIGVSSMQLDEAERGFSFAKAGPIDMRMGGDGPSARDLVNSLPAGSLTRIIGILGEERRASAVARAIVAARPLSTTTELAAAVERAIGRKPGEIHPATRTFQALRIYVNGELEELAEALLAAERILKEGGRLVVVAFHSLEDRIVKRFLADRSARTSGGSRHRPEAVPAAPTFRLLAKGAVVASPEEAGRNPRARSAKLRAAERTAAPARDADFVALGVPALAIEGV